MFWRSIIHRGAEKSGANMQREEFGGNAILTINKKKGSRITIRVLLFDSAFRQVRSGNTTVFRIKSEKTNGGVLCDDTEHQEGLNRSMKIQHAFSFHRATYRNMSVAGKKN
jgi:hypothetical protein